MKVLEFLNESHVPYEILCHEPTYDAQHMAHAVHVKGAAVAKTVLLRADPGYRYMTAILPATHMIDFDVASQSLGRCELRLASEVEISEVCPDCEFGILLPFGSQYGVKTVVDASLAKEDEIVFEGSTHHESIRMKFADFCRLESPLIVPLTRPT
jgi:Ala-tRNA(Pro) deacylase